MAFTAHTSERMMEELRDEPAVVDTKARRLAEMIRDARHVVFFTGAGISTSAGIADYRGPDGVWTLEAKGEGHRVRSKEMVTAVPTPTHMAIAELVRAGRAHHVISQNVDGLHRKSGVPPGRLSELHGNSNIEYCTQCRREYLRDFNVTTDICRGGADRAGGGGGALGAHETGRRCVAAGCGGALHDTIINFGEGLPVEAVQQGFAHAEQADLHIVIGSSLTVAPASDMPRATKRGGGKLAIVNLQRTAQDDAADLRAHCGADELMARVAAHLGVDLPPFRLRRAAAVWRGADGGARCAGVGDDGAPATLFRRCAFAAGAGGRGAVAPAADDVVVDCPGGGVGGAAVHVTCEFYGHYGERPVELTLPEGVEVRRFQLSCDPAGGEWAVEHTDGGAAPSTDDAKPGKGGAATAAVHRAAATADKPGVDYTGWHAVQPLDDCPHTASGVANPDELCADAGAPCATCGNVGENMLCLSCRAVHCGRHVHQHMLAHHDATGHPIVCGFVDLSFWCYHCDAYIAPGNPRLLPYYAALHTARFGAPPPSAVAAGFVATPAASGKSMG